MPRQRLAQAVPSCSSSESKSPNNLVSQKCQLLAQEVEKELAFSVPWTAGSFQFHRTPAWPWLTCIWLSGYLSFISLQKPFYSTRYWQGETPNFLFCCSCIYWE